MREEESYHDLTALFAAEDRKLDGKPFVEGVMTGIRRKSMMRRFVLFGVGAAGAVVAAFQVPSLLGDWVKVDVDLLTTLGTAQDQIGALAATNPLWLAIAGMVTLSLLAVATFERT